LARKGPDGWRVEYPLTAGAGLCPRGSALGELLAHPRRILAAGRGGRPAEPDAALRAVLDEAAGRTLTVLLDGNLPWEQLAAAAAWVDAWPQAELCLVVEPAEEQLVRGLDAAGADYLPRGGLESCDGFLIVGDVFSTDPLCSRGVLDRHVAEPKTPIVVVDPGCGPAVKFASYVVDVAPGLEAAALAAIARAAGVKTEAGGAEVPSATEAGKALAGCKRLGVLVAAEPGRSDDWARVGRLAGEIAKALGGAVAAQTDGANVLAAVRLAARAGTVPLGAALAAEGRVRIAVGCDVLGMLGLGGPAVFAAAAPLPNVTTEAAEVVLPLALPGEYDGTYFLDDGVPHKVERLMAAPAGVPTPGELVAALARAGGVTAPPAVLAEWPERAAEPAPAETAAASDPAGLVLLFGREAAQAGCGALTSHATWQAASQPVPEVRISEADAREAGVESLDPVRVSTDAGSIAARVRVAPELPAGRVVLPAGAAAARALAPMRLVPERAALVPERRRVEVSR